MVLFISINSRKGQIWSLDLVIASIIFLTGIIVLYVYAINYTSQTQNQLEEFFYEGNLASQLILSEDVGILSNHKINQTKLDNFYFQEYSKMKNILGVTNDFYFYFQGLKINGTSIDHIGKINGSSVDNFVKVSRITLYENKPVKFQVFVWGKNE